MSNSKNNKKNRTLIITIILVVLVVIGIVLITKGTSNNLEKMVDNTKLEKSESYKMDLRIYGTYNNKSINNIIMISNYKDTDKDISISSNGKEERYLIKGKDKYKIVDEKLNKVDSVPYSDTEVYLNGLDKLKNVKQKDDKKIGDNTYKVYEGVIAGKDMDNMLKASKLDIKFDEDVKTEVWLTSDNYVYKIYYKIGDLTIYPSYFGYGNMNKVNLDMYK